jgi:hypothetical protein
MLVAHRYVELMTAVSVDVSSNLCGESKDLRRCEVRIHCRRIDGIDACASESTSDVLLCECFSKSE